MFQSLEEQITRTHEQKQSALKRLAYYAAVLGITVLVVGGLSMAIMLLE